jgi:peptide/nickel transport system permease protein
MKTYIFRRLLQAILVLFILSIVIFLVMRLLPGDPILMLITGDELSQSSEERIQALRREFGLDRPLPLQYLSWLKDVLRGDLGTSIVHRDKVEVEIRRRLPITIHLGVSAFALGILLGIPLGIISAVRRGTWWDSIVTFLANLGITAPPFWLGVLLIYFLGLYLKLLPIFGYTSPLEDFWMSVRQAIMPVICLAVYPVAATARQTRSSMLEVIPQDYIRTAWAKGLTERLVIARHALKNALIPVATLQGIILRFVLGGSVIVETVFNIPGMGRLAVEAIVAQDYPVVQGVILVVGIITILINLLVDLLYVFLDPRIRYE